MNALFVNVKVDREERPDLDQIYQAAHALLTRRSGGWPLTMFLTPDGEPYFGGTYFPKERRGTACRDSWSSCRASRRRTASRATRSPSRAPGCRRRWPGLEPPRRCRGRAAPRSRCAGARRPEGELRSGARRFRRGAQVSASGRARFLPARPRGDRRRRGAVDRAHHARRDGRRRHPRPAGRRFLPLQRGRRMVDPALREDALRQRAAARAVRGSRARATGDAAFADVARGIVGWMEREMRAPDGAFYSSLDADSEGEEGRFYVWTRPAFRAALTADEYAVAAPVFGLDGPPNFEDHAWNLRVARPLDAGRRRAGPLAAGRADPALRGARRAVRRPVGARAAGPRRQGADGVERARHRRPRPRFAGARRAALGRPRPGCARCAQADRLARRPALRDAPRRGRAPATASSTTTRSCSPRCSRCCRRGSTRPIIAGRARSPTCCSAQFEDPAAGGFFFTSHDHEALIHRSKPGHDNATPSGNGVAAQALIALGHLAAEPRYVERRGARPAAGSPRRWPRSPRRVRLAAHRASRTPSRRRRRCCSPAMPNVCDRWQRTLERAYRPRVRVFRPGSGDGVPAALRKGRAARNRGAGVGLPRDAVPAAGGDTGRSRRCARRLSNLSIRVGGPARQAGAGLPTAETRRRRRPGDPWRGARGLGKITDCPATHSMEIR